MALSNDFDFLIQWHLTERCNLHCRHCYQSGGQEDELSPAEKRDLLEEIAEMLAGWEKCHGIDFAPSFNITGGEPLLSPDLFPVMAEIARLGYDQSLLTNGTLVTPENAARLAAMGVTGVQVSIEGPPEVHDAIRGAGSFAAAVTGVGHLLKSGLQVTLNATLSRLNAPYLDSMLALATELGVQRLGLTRLVPYGHGRDISGEMLSPAEVRRLYETAFATDIPGLKVVTGDPVAAQLSDGRERIPGSPPCGGCAAGVSGLTIMADGTILPCRRLPVPIGNVRTDSLREVWATSEVLARLREQRLYQGKCASCARWSVCRGCRGVAYANARLQGSDDYLAEDPQCFI
jgi:radical SAM protein with 4Fe4S-binding SPASM domain